MTTKAAPATETHWCAIETCYDTIQPGEMAVTDPDLKDPLGEPGFAHLDCAEADGWEVEETEGESDGPAEFRAGFRSRLREGTTP